jgi:prepilin-type N-terminal cleavage/methylation domain-containing protein
MKAHQGFALIEVLIAVAIASIIVLSVYSGVSAGTLSISQNANLTRAIIIAKSKMNDFKLSGMRGTDLANEEVREYPEFTFSRTTVRYENPVISSTFGALSAKKTTIIVEWNDSGRKRSFSLYTVYPEL